MKSKKIFGLFRSNVWPVTADKVYISILKFGYFFNF